MLLVARKNLFSERTRLAISVGGIALSVLLITFLLSLFRGWNEKVGGFVEEVDADIWIAREGTTDFLAAASILPTEGADEQISRIQSIERWSPLIVRPMAATKDGTEMDVELVGFDTQSGLGGPVRIEEGKGVPGPGEVVVDEELSRRYGVDVGDTIGAGGRDWEVVGKSSGGDFVAAQTIFVALDQAEDALEMEGFATFFLLQVRPGREKVVVGFIEKGQPGVVAVTGDEFAAATRERALGDVIPILSVILVLAFIVGLAVAGLTIYTATVEKTREYGILKAVGFTNGYLYRVVFEQSLVTGFLGFVLGAGLTLLAGPFVRDFVPQFVLFVRWQDVLAVAGFTLLMAVLAAYVPVRRLAAIDPVEVFKA